MRKTIYQPGVLTVSASSPEIYNEYQAYLAANPMSPLSYHIPTRPFYRGKYMTFIIIIVRIYAHFSITMCLTVF